MDYYAGIGNRNTPEPCLKMMEKIGRACSRKGLVLRSGGAKGADSAFEVGCDVEKGSKQIWRPRAKDIPEYEWAVEKAKEVCWEFPLNRMKPYTRSLIIRNMYQVFGDNPDRLDPVKFVVFYCEGDPLMVGKESGGTRYAVRAAHLCNIPIFNLRVSQTHFAHFLKSYPDPVSSHTPF